MVSVKIVSKPKGYRFNSQIVVVEQCGNDNAGYTLRQNSKASQYDNGGQLIFNTPMVLSTTYDLDKLFYYQYP